MPTGGEVEAGGPVASLRAGDPKRPASLPSPCPSQAADSGTRRAGLRRECWESCGGTQQDQARRGARKMQEATPILPAPRGVNPQQSSGRSASWPEPCLLLRTQKNWPPRTSQQVPGLRLPASNAGTQVQFLLGELSSQTSHGMAIFFFFK